MRKVLAVLLSVMLIMSASITAFGATQSDVEAKINSSVAYALDGNYGKDGYNVGNAKYFLEYLRAGNDGAQYEKKYLASVKSALDGGKLADVGSLGLTLQIMDLLGVDARGFEGYDIVKLFEATDVTENGGSPYNYVYATEAAAAYGLDAYGEKLCDQVVSYYEMGIGTAFWGEETGILGADDLCMFILALAPYVDYYAMYIDNAFTLLKAYDSADGFTAFDEANANSTALALAAYSALGNKKMADQIYDKLVKFYDGATGGFNGSNDDNVATDDAIFGMEYYLELADKDPEPETTTETTTAAPAETTTEATTAAPTTEAPTAAPTTEAPAEATTKAPATEKATEAPETTTEKAPLKSPETGAQGSAAVAFAAIALAGAVVMLAKKKDNE